MLAEMARRTILIAEDDADLRQLYRTALTLAGFDVRDAGSGLQALAQIDQSAPDLVVLDLSLPRISGRQVLQELAGQAHTRQIPVVVVTGSSEPLDFLDVACILRKPISTDELITAIRRCIASGRGAVP
jgi:CheY-like chemotaxis protein